MRATNPFALWALSLCLSGSFLRADTPAAMYIFPAGGQRGATVDVRVGGLNLHRTCGFELLGMGVKAPSTLQRTRTIWFEGPVLPLPESQQQEDYPKDMAGRFEIAADAALGVRHWRLTTDQGATPAMKFVVGDLPEVVEDEVEGDPVPVHVKLPLTINGRIFPREDVDAWTCSLRKGQMITASVAASRIGSPLDARLQVFDPQGKLVAENDDAASADAGLSFTANADGVYQVRIHDINTRGGQAYVYRLTLTDGPWVQSVYPLGGQRGSKTAFELTGPGLGKGPVELSLPAAGPRDHAARLTIAGRETNPFLLELDDLPEQHETEPNDAPEPVQPLTVPAVCNGRIGKPGDVDWWAISTRKGEAFEIELRAARLGSLLQGVLAVTDAAGKELARGEASGQAEPLLRFTAPADGTYRIRVADLFRSRGSANHAYRLRIASPAAPDFHLRLVTDALTVPRGGQAKLRVQLERLGGFAESVQLDFDGLPEGVTAGKATIAKGQATTDVTLSAAATAAVRTGRVTVRGTAPVNGQPANRTATLTAPRGEPELDHVLLAVAVPTPFKVVGVYDMQWAARGTVLVRNYRIERNGFDGPLEVSMADKQARHLQGVTGPTLTVPAGVSEFSYPAFLPPWMETGRTSRSCVMAVGIVKDADGAEHVVSYTSLNQNEQLVAVVEPERLSVEVDRANLVAEPGRTVALPVRVARGKGLTGAVKVELVTAAHARAVTADIVEVPAEQSSTTLPIRFASDARGPFTMPFTIRATLLDNSRPVVAETKLEVLTAP